MYFKTLLFISLLGFSYLFADTKLLILGSGTPNPNPETVSYTHLTLPTMIGV